MSIKGVYLASHTAELDSILFPLPLSQRCQCFLVNSIFVMYNELLVPLVKMPKVFTSGVGTFPENLETSIILYFKNHATSYLKGFEHYSMGQYLSRVVPLNLISSLFLVIVQNHISFS